jgi:integrase
LTVGDLLSHDRLDVPVSRKGKGQKAAERKPVPIPPTLAAKLRLRAAGRRPDEPLLVDGDGVPWATGCQTKPFAEGVKAAGVAPSITCYALRHSSIARQLLGGVPAAVVASNHDTSVKEIEAHYAKYITDVSDGLTRKTLLSAAPGAANDNHLPRDSAVAR